jgi:hypothetical protein
MEARRITLPQTNGDHTAGESVRQSGEGERETSDVSPLSGQSGDHVRPKGRSNPATMKRRKELRKVGRANDVLARLANHVLRAYFSAS